MRITGNHILYYIQKVNDLYHFIESAHDALENQNRDHTLAFKSSGISSLLKLAPGYLLVNVVPKDHSAIPLNKKSIPMRVIQLIHQYVAPKKHINFNQCLTRVI